MHSKGMLAGRRCMVPRSGKHVCHPVKARLRDEARIWVSDPPLIPAPHPSLQHPALGQSFRVLHLTLTTAGLELFLQKGTEAEG